MSLAAISVLIVAALILGLAVRHQLRRARRRRLIFAALEILKRRDNVLMFPHRAERLSA